jgi:hypothetical protein
MRMPKYQKGKSNKLTHKTSVWALVAKGRFGAFEDLRSMKAKEKLLRSVETKPNISKEIKVSEVQYDDLAAYQKQRQLQRQQELEAIRAKEKQQQEQRALEVERLKKGFSQPRSTYVESDYIQWVDPHKPINQGKLGSSQAWRRDKKKYEYY